MKKQMLLLKAALAACVAAGLILLLYPTVSDLWNSYHQSKVVVAYTKKVSGMSGEEKEAMLEAAAAYNRKLFEGDVSIGELSEEEKKEYEATLDVTGTGIMGYVEIPQIGALLSIYHGASEAVLTTGAGHIEGTSLPVGGINTHTVISGHRGLPSAKLFTDIDQLEEGSIFYLHVLEETLAYEVDQILTVEPHQIEALAIEEGEDYCTLVTCTPYGVNSHRLLVRGRRIPAPEDEKAIEPKVDRTFFAALAAITFTLLGGAGAIWRINSRRSRRRGRKGRRR